MSEITAETPPRTFRCTCGRTLGTIARERGGPTTLTPAPDVIFRGVSGSVVLLECSCGVVSPWFCPSERGSMPKPPGTL